MTIYTTTQVYAAQHSSMVVYLIAGFQYRAYCEVCDVGLNWYADDEGRAYAELHADFHRCSA